MGVCVCDTSSEPLYPCVIYINIRASGTCHPVRKESKYTLESVSY